MPLIGKLASLQYLEIQIPPLEASDMRHISPDQVCYISVLADLIASTALSLETLSIGFLRRIKYYEFGRNHRLRVQIFRTQISQTMLEIFSSLFSTAEEWPSLRSVSLTGFFENNKTQEAQELLNKLTTTRTEMESSLVRRGITLKWKDESTMPGVLFLEYENMRMLTSLVRFVEAYEHLE